MNTQPCDAEQLEEILIQTMVMLLVRTPNGWTRVERAIANVRDAGAGMITPSELAELRGEGLRLVR